MSTMKCLLLHGAFLLFFSSKSITQAGTVRSSRSVPLPVHCLWGSWSEWSPCDACSKTQTQIRFVDNYPQFKGQPCMGEWSRTQPCVTTRVCPLQDGCGGRFRCQSGQCISQSLVCNGDLDCEDSTDEQKCDAKPICDLQKPPPNIEVTGHGFDAVQNKARGSVINTKSFGGRCTQTFSGNHKDFYRLPESVLKYSFQVTAKNDFTDESFESSWHYVHHTEKHEKTTGTDYGHDDYVFHDELLKNQTKSLLIIKSDLEVGQFQNQAPEYLPLSEEFWKALVSLPVIYDYAAYRRVLERFGTHFMSEGNLGGQFKLYLMASHDLINSLKQETRSYKHCTVTHHSIMFFIRWSTEHCDYDDINEKDPFYESIPKTDMKTEILGGDPGFIAKLLVFNKHSVKENVRTFSQWSGSVKEFPGIIKSKMRSLHELVKEVPCAGLKRLLLKRAIETYLTEKHPCQCRACQNNGLRVLDQDVCKCVCKPGTSGLACEEGAPHNEQPGMIHGDWACWSSWSSCSDGKKSRSRTCSRPSPSGGGRNCAGDTEETGACDEEDELNHLRMMEPHCFDESLTPRKSCTTPPFLANGFVLHPKDFYSVGSKVEYTCIEGYRLTGNAFIACQENLEWYPPAMECKRTVCIPPQLPPDVSASPWTLSYKTGDAVTLSCPEGQLREGPGQIRCNAGLAWSPQPKNIKCIKAPTPTSAPMQCQPWENLAKDKCVCKMPTECKLSLELCATDAQHSRTLRLTVCKIQASRCLGHPFSLAEDSACQWPQRSSTACTQCTAWETCDEQTKSCRCKSIEECSSLGAWIKVCVQQDENSAPVTMTECEAAVRRCRGETVRILNILKCPT